MINFANIYFVIDLIVSIWIYYSNKKLCFNTDKSLTIVRSLLSWEKYIKFTQKYYY